ncbi:hypothetical protein [Aquimarina muelleri]|uniref:Membrane protein n=1 Tax=Aquimarina muelleri TaxID=279356 RepID=A0A918JVJ0_9FLAO|nr:hypothetical protein [Aquimarina muelleri]MCX2764416.1 hypothetical protein [Aquimarina muelleri]GGX21190.1 membrane protein [Aquimarina muelleri]
MKKSTILIFLLLIAGKYKTLAQQDNTDSNPIGKTKEKTKNKGKVYFYWGWNISQYSSSDIRFYGDNYDFTVQNTKAEDKVAKPIGYDKYLNPGNMTIPQTNARLGYYFHDNWNASIGLDHMKYVVTQFQTAQVSGDINLTSQNEGFTSFNGVYNNTDTILSEEFVSFEHTDGLNYINLEVARVDNLGDYIGLNPDKIQINLTEGLSAGMLIPKTNSKILGKERYDEFHLAGYGISLKGGINVTFFKYFFIQAEVKTGFINLPDIRTTKNSADRAKQHFFFSQQNITFGGIFKVF